MVYMLIALSVLNTALLLYNGVLLLRVGGVLLEQRDRDYDSY